MELIDDYIFEEEIRLACDFSMGGKKQWVWKKKKHE
jgi:hypothetical protein